MAICTHSLLGIDGINELLKKNKRNSRYRKCGWILHIHQVMLVFLDAKNN
jgi:hypothetical protein